MVKRITRTNHAQPLAPECLRALVGDPDDFIWVQVWYHNGFSRTHCVSRGFLQQLERWLAKHNFDMVWRPL
jgi:hypothetical protein